MKSAIGTALDRCEPPDLRRKCVQVEFWLAVLPWTDRPGSGCSTAIARGDSKGGDWSGKGRDGGPALRMSMTVVRYVPFYADLRSWLSTLTNLVVHLVVGSPTRPTSTHPFLGHSPAERDSARTTISTVDPSGLHGYKDASSASLGAAFSAEGGETWETNWTMDFSRAPDLRTPSPIPTRRLDLVDPTPPSASLR